MDAVTYDLHADPVMNEGNVMTEYEERFSAKGNKINKYILKRKPEGRLLLTFRELCYNLSAKIRSADRLPVDEPVA